MTFTFTCQLTLLYSSTDTYATFRSYTSPKFQLFTFHSNCFISHNFHCSHTQFTSTAFNGHIQTALNISTEILFDCFYYFLVKQHFKRLQRVSTESVLVFFRRYMRLMSSPDISSHFQILTHWLTIQTLSDLRPSSLNNNKKHFHLTWHFNYFCDLWASW